MVTICKVHTAEATAGRCKWSQFVRYIQPRNYSLKKIKTMGKFDLDVPIKGKNPMEYMASLIEANENQSIEIERGKMSVAVLKQMNNRSRLLLDAAKYELKCVELRAKQQQEQ